VGLAADVQNPQKRAEKARRRDADINPHNRPPYPTGKTRKHT